MIYSFFVSISLSELSNISTCCSNEFAAKKIQSENERPKLLELELELELERFIFIVIC